MAKNAREKLVELGSSIRMRRLLPAFGIVVIAGLTLTSGVIHGRISNRWGPPGEMRAAAKVLKEVPTTDIGNWHMVSSEEMEPKVVDMLRCEGYILRTYENSGTGDTVNVVVLLGPAGQISVHTPVVCMQGSYGQLQDPQRVTIDTEGSKEEFWAAPFRSTDLEANRHQVLWAWSTGSHWSAPGSDSRWTFWKQARFVFSGSPYLYKIQLASRLSPDADTEAGDPCQRFLKDFVPVVKKHLVDPSGT